MIPAAFEYFAPATVDEALGLLREHSDAKVLAGGQSLMPALRLRLAAPEVIVDIQKIDDLRGVRDDGDALVIGAMTPHSTVESDPLVAEHARLIALATATVGDPQIRHRGTFGGSLAHADPAADWPAVLMALDASVVIAGPRGERTMKVEELIVGPLMTALDSGEILTQVRVTLPPARTAGAYEKLPNPASRFAVIGVAAEVSLDGRSGVAWSRIALTGLGSKVSRATAVEQALQGKPADPATIKSASARAAEGLELRPDLTGSAAYKAQLAAVYTERAVLRAVSRARER